MDSEHAHSGPTQCDNHDRSDQHRQQGSRLRGLRHGARGPRRFGSDLRECSPRRRRLGCPRLGRCARRRLNGRGRRRPRDACARPGHELRHAGTILRVGAQTAGHDVAECRGKIGRQHDGFPGLAQARRRTASERFEQADAERPDVTGSGTASVPGFRRIVYGGRVGARSCLR